MVKLCKYELNYVLSFFPPNDGVQFRRPQILEHLSVLAMTSKSSLRESLNLNTLYYIKKNKNGFMRSKPWQASQIFLSLLFHLGVCYFRLGLFYSIVTASSVIKT